MLEQKIEQDLKTALLQGDHIRVSVLRGLKSALLYEKVAKGKRDTGLTDEEIVVVLSKEAKKRQESADLYVQGNSKERAETELAEKAIIEEYLPTQLSEEELTTIVEQTIKELKATDIKSMGGVIGAVKKKTAGAADGAVIARLVKERLS